MKLKQFTSSEEFQKIINIPLAVIFASLIIIIVTTNMTDTNGLSALLGGYSGLFLGMFFVILINLLFTNASYLGMFPIVMILAIAGLLVFYLSVYFDRISKGEVSDYYIIFSTRSTMFLVIQLFIIFSAMYSKTLVDKNTTLFDNTTISLLGLFSVINMLFVLTIGIVLKFYSTQG
jgi:hypothetical protein